jgi:hypothetical protein
MSKELGLEGHEYNNALVIFFAPYIVFEIPSNILLKKFKPHVWLSACMFLFGITTTLQGVVTNYSGLLATRFFLGMFEYLPMMQPYCLEAYCFRRVRVGNVPRLLLLAQFLVLANGSTEEIQFLLLKYDTRRCFCWTARSSYRKNGWYRRLSRLEMGE